MLKAQLQQPAGACVRGGLPHAPQVQANSLLVEVALESGPAAGGHPGPARPLATAPRPRLAAHSAGAAPRRAPTSRARRRCAPELAAPRFLQPGHHDLVQLLLYSPANLLPQTPNPNPGGGGSGGSGKMPMPALVHDDDDE